MLDRYSLNVKAVVLAMEYRRVANCYLSHKTISSIDEIDLGPLPDVRVCLSQIRSKIERILRFTT